MHVKMSCKWLFCIHRILQTGYHIQQDTNRPNLFKLDFAFDDLTLTVWNRISVLLSLTRNENHMCGWILYGQNDMIWNNIKDI